MGKTNRYSVRKLCITGLLTALSVVIGILCKNLFTWQIYYRVTFENFPILFVGCCFGPLWGMASGVCADIISCLCSTNPAVNPIITCGAAAVGAISGLVPLIFRKMHLFKKPKLALAFSVGLAHLIGQVLIKSIGKILYFGMPWWGSFVALGISCGVAPLEFLAILLLLRNPEIKKTLRGMVSYEL